jgi:hypothetical protein
MNYQELTQCSLNDGWATKLKERADATNAELLAKRQSALDARTTIAVGDFVRDGENWLRVAHHWGDSLQLTDGRFGASFHIGKDGYCSFSGGLNPGIPIGRFKPTGERRAGSCWFFSEENVMAHNGFYTSANFRVWDLAHEN